MTVAAALFRCPMSELMPGYHAILPPDDVECVIVRYIDWCPDGVWIVVADPDDLTVRRDFFAPYNLIVEAHRGDDAR